MTSRTDEIVCGLAVRAGRIVSLPLRILLGVCTLRGSRGQRHSELVHGESFLRLELLLTLDRPLLFTAFHSRHFLILVYDRTFLSHHQRSDHSYRSFSRYRRRLILGNFLFF
jgi:hypothetical protein